MRYLRKDTKSLRNEQRIANNTEKKELLIIQR